MLKAKISLLLSTTYLAKPNKNDSVSVPSAAVQSPTAVSKRVAAS